MRTDSISNSPCTADCDYGQNMETAFREENGVHEDERRCDDTVVLIFVENIAPLRVGQVESDRIELSLILINIYGS